MILRIYSLTNIHVFLIGFLKVCYVHATTCFYLDQNSYAIHQIYCDGQCCQGYGQKEEICCSVTWSAGVIVGISIGGVAIVSAIIVVSVYLCLRMKKKRKQGVDPQTNTNGLIELQLNNNPVGTSSRTNVRDVTSSLSLNSQDLPPPYSPSLNLHRPVSGHGSQSSPISFINEPDRLGKPNLKPPPYTAQTMRSPARGGRLAPHMYNFQPSPARSLAPSRAW